MWCFVRTILTSQTRPPPTIQVPPKIHKCKEALEQPWLWQRPHRPSVNNIMMQGLQTMGKKIVFVRTRADFIMEVTNRVEQVEGAAARARSVAERTRSTSARTINCSTMTVTWLHFTDSKILSLLLHHTFRTVLLLKPIPPITHSLSSSYIPSWCVCQGNKEYTHCKKTLNYYYYNKYLSLAGTPSTLEQKNYRTATSTWPVHLILVRQTYSHIITLNILCRLLRLWFNVHCLMEFLWLPDKDDPGTTLSETFTHNKQYTNIRWITWKISVLYDFAHNTLTSLFIDTWVTPMVTGA